MRVTNTSNHPLIQLIGNCSRLDSNLKSEAIRDITKIIIDGSYLNRVTMKLFTGYYIIRWGETDLGYNKWKQIYHILSPIMYYEMYSNNSCLKISL